jgi:hypothetical protein
MPESGKIQFYDIKESKMNRSKMMKGWIGVDLDGTLAESTKWVSPSHIGEPIHKMVERVKKLD